MLNATAFVAVPSMMFGAIEVLVPLRIDALGGGHALIAGWLHRRRRAGGGPGPGRGALFRSGRPAHSPYTVGLTICAVAMIAIAAAQTLGAVLAGLILTSLGAGICFAPALTMLSEAAESSRLHQGFAAGLSNMAWAAGQVVGGVAGGGVASVTGNAAPSLAITALLLATAAYARRVLAPPAAQPVRFSAVGDIWRNWAGDQSCEPAEIVQPRSREELAEAVLERRGGREEGERRRLGALVHRCGADRRHAGRDRGAERCDRRRPLLGPGQDRGGTVLADLNEALSRLGLAMENLGDIDRQTIAGAISTGTHGTGARLRNISSQVEGSSWSSPTAASAS